MNRSHFLLIIHVIEKLSTIFTLHNNPSHVVGSKTFKLGASGVEEEKRISAIWRGVPDNVDAALFWPAQRGWVRCTTSSFGELNCI